MKRKRLLVVAVTLSVIFTLTACKLGKTDSGTPESTTDFNNSVNQNVYQNTEATAFDTVETNNKETSGSSAVPSTNSSSGSTTADTNDDPADWSKEKIVEEYKKAATKSNENTTSTMKITLKDISVNNGEYDKAMSMVKPIIGKFIESSSTENAGITGGFYDLVPQDVSSAKAYKSGNNTVIELTMYEQTSGPKEDANSGSVGHAITAVGDISVVVSSLSDMGLPLELSEQDTVIYYTNPNVKVVIDENGEIVSGTWSYTVEICMNNMKAFGQTVEKASITMDNTITV